MAVLTTTNAIIPKAMISTVRTVRSILLRTERKESDRISRNLMFAESNELVQFKGINFDNRPVKLKEFRLRRVSLLLDVPATIIFSDSKHHQFFLQRPADGIYSSGPV